MVSQEFKKCDIAVLPGTRLFHKDSQGDLHKTPWHTHYSFGFVKGGNSHTGISIFLGKEFDETKSYVQSLQWRQTLLAGFATSGTAVAGWTSLSLVSTFPQSLPAQQADTSTGANAK